MAHAHPSAAYSASNSASLVTMKLHSGTSRVAHSVPPEQLLRALLLQVLYSIRSERMLMEQLEYNLLFRWFVGLEMDDPVWDVTESVEQYAKRVNLPPTQALDLFKGDGP